MKTIVLCCLLAQAASADIIPIDLGPPRNVRSPDSSDTFIPFQNIHFTGQTLSLDFDFGGEFIRLQKGNAALFDIGLRFALVSGSVAMPLTKSAYLVGSEGQPIGGYVGFGGLTPVGASFLPLFNSSPVFPVDIYGAHLQFTFAEPQDFVLSGLLQLSPAKLNSGFLIGSVPDRGSTCLLFAFGLLVLVSGAGKPKDSRADQFIREYDEGKHPVPQDVQDARSDRLA